MLIQCKTVQSDAKNDGNGGAGDMKKAVLASTIHYDTKCH